MANGRENIARIFKALGDSNRLDIVMSIGEDARSVTEIISAIGLSQTLVSFHLRILREANIVTTKRNGPFIFYRLSDPVINNILLKLSRKFGSSGNKTGIVEPGGGQKKSNRKEGKLIPVGK